MFICARKPILIAIIVKLDDSSNVGHVPDLLAHTLAPMLDGGVIAHMEGMVTGITRSAPEGFLV